MVHSMWTSMPDGCRGPAVCGSFRGPCGRRCGEAGVTMAAEVALQDSASLVRSKMAPQLPVLSRAPEPVGHAARPCADCSDIDRRHGIGEVNAPVVAVVDIAHSRACRLRHNRVGLAQQRFADQAHADAALDASMAARRPAPRLQSRERRIQMSVFRHQKSLQSVQTPMEHMRT